MIVKPLLDGMKALGVFLALASFVAILLYCATQMPRRAA